jgi:hypothetical protein
MEGVVHMAFDISPPLNITNLFEIGFMELINERKDRD